MKRRSKNTLLRVGLPAVIGLLFILFVVAPTIKDRTLTESSTVLTQHGYTIIETYGEYSRIYEQQDYIVERNGIIDTVGICLNDGNVIITTTIDHKKTLPVETFSGLDMINPMKGYGLFD